MNRSLFALSLASVILLNAPVPAPAPTDRDVANWLDRDVTMLINIRDVATTWENIKSLDLFSNPRFIKAIQMLSDERFPVIDAESAEQLRTRLRDLESLVRRIGQISFAIHEIDENRFYWSLFVRAESGVLDKIQSGLPGIDGPSGKEGRPPVNADPRPDPDDTGNQRGKFLWGDVGEGKFRRVGEWLILSNYDPFLDALTDRISDEGFRSLAKSRKYRSILKRASPLNDRDGLITIYGNPVRMRYFFPNVTQDQWEAWATGELPACGVNLVITGPSDGNPAEPVMLADVVVPFTRPATGWAATFQCYRPVEVPPLAVEPIELLAFSRNEAALFEEAVRRDDTQQGEGAAVDRWGALVRDLRLDNLNDAISRRQAFCEMRYIGENQTAERPGIVSMERVLDTGAAQRFATAVAQLANDKYEQNLGSHRDDSGNWWTVPPEQFDQNSGLDAFDRNRNSGIDFYNCQQDAYTLTGDWWVQGDMPAVRDQVALLANPEGEDHGQSIRDLVRNLTRQLGAEERPCILSYFTSDSWQENLDNLEQQYANSNARPVEMNWKFVQGSGNRIVLELQPDSETPAGIRGGSLEIQVDGIGSASSEGGDDRPVKGLSLSGLEIVQLMMPMRLTDRNEDGYRFEVKRREDLETAIRLMILKSLSESFPRQLLLFARHDNHIRIMLGVYPAVIGADND